MGGRNYAPCRVCGNQHRNPRSSSICSPCGAAESEANERVRMAAAMDFEESSFGRFMSMPEDDRWRAIFDRLESLEVS